VDISDLTKAGIAVGSIALTLSGASTSTIRYAW
jgi:hypothetical protein